METCKDIFETIMQELILISNWTFAKCLCFVYLLQIQPIKLDTKQFQCPVCNRVFTKGSHAKRHILIHTGEKPYICSFCNMAFTRQSTLTKHIERRHIQTPLSILNPWNWKYNVVSYNRSVHFLHLTFAQLEILIFATLFVAAWAY